MGLRLAIHSAAVLAALVAAAPARAHPHVFAAARLDVALDPDRNVGSLRHLWSFNDLFSSTVLLQFDEDQDLDLDASELRRVGETVMASLSGYNYFQLVTADGRDVPMLPPSSFVADYESGQLSIAFETQPEEPLKLGGKLGFGVYDPTFYTAIDFVEDDDPAVQGLPEGCTRTVVRPKAEEAIAANKRTLTDAFFSDPLGNDLSRVFATRLEISCPG